MAVTATRSSTTEPMLVGDAYYIGMPQADEAPPREAWQGCRNGNCGPPRPNVSRRQARVGYRPWYCSVTGRA